MPSDPTKPLLRLEAKPMGDRQPRKPGFPPSPTPFPRERQERKFGPKLQRIADVLERDPSGLELTTDPTALAPERLLVFEVKGLITDFAKAIARIDGLEFLDEDELAKDDDKAPAVYLLVPDARALKEIIRLWQLWLENKELGTGFAPWGHVFSLLRDLRLWGPIWWQNNNPMSN